MKQESSFYLSLFVFILLLCSCKSKEVATQRLQQLQVLSDISTLSEQAKADTTKTKIIEQTEEFTRITETEIITEYDTEKQTPSKVTEKKKVTEQGKQTKTDSSENRGLTEIKKDSTDHFVDINEMVETKEDVKEESAGSTFLPTLAKWLGIGIVVLIFIGLIWKKLKGLLPL